MNFCSNCGAKVTQEAKFCAGCGHSLSEGHSGDDTSATKAAAPSTPISGQACPFCRTSIADGAIACVGCGATYMKVAQAEPGGTGFVAFVGLGVLFVSFAAWAVAGAKGLIVGFVLVPLWIVGVRKWGNRSRWYRRQ